jgi:hypothetical protein
VPTVYVGWMTGGVVRNLTSTTASSTTNVQTSATTNDCGSIPSITQGTASLPA